MKTKLTLGATLVLLCFYSSLLLAQTLDRKFYTPNSTVRSSVQDGNNIFIAGDFTQLGIQANSLARINSGTTVPDVSFPQFDKGSIVDAAEPDGSGGFYISGSLNAFNGTLFAANTRLIHIFSNGKLDIVFAPVIADAPITTLKKKGSMLYIGGYFSSVNGSLRDKMGAINAVSGTLLSWSTAESVTGVPTSLEVADTMVFVSGVSYVGNYFTGLSQFAAFSANSGKYIRSFPNFNSTVTSLLSDNNSLYVGGSFTKASWNVHGLAGLNATSSNVDFSIPSTNGYVSAVIADGSGGFYIGGSFTTVGNTARSNLAHILSDGSIDPAFDVNVNASVWCLDKDGTNLYLGGTFSLVNDSSRNYAAAVNLSTGVLQSWDPNPDSYLYDVKCSSNKIYMAGSFTTVKGVARNYVAAVTTSNTLTSWAPNPDSYVRKIAVNTSGTFIYLAGDFTTIKGSSRNYLAKVDVNTGNLINSWNPNPNNSVYSVYISGNKVFAGGYFSTIKTTFNRNYFAALDSATAIPTSLIANANNLITSINTNGSQLYLGGYFTEINSKPRAYIASINLLSDTLESWAPSFGGVVNSIGFAGSIVIAGGDFSSINAGSRSSIASVNVQTSSLNSWSSKENITGTINKIYKNSNDLFLGGSFYYLDGANYINNIMSISTISGNITHNFTMFPNSYVYDITIASGKLMVSGPFSGFIEVITSAITPRNYLADYSTTTFELSSNVYAPDSYSGAFQQGNMFTDLSGNVIIANNTHFWNLVNRNYLAALDITTGMPTEWNPNSNSPVWALAIKDSLLFVGGPFSNIGGQNRQYVAAISTNTGLAKSWNADADNYVYSLAIQDSTLFIGGNFANIKGVARNNAAAISTTGNGTVKTWNPGPDAVVRTIQPLPAAMGGDIFLGGEFTTVKGVTRNYLARVNNNNGNLIGFNPNPDGYINSLLFDPTTSVLYVGGNNMSTIGGQTRYGIAAYNTINNTLRPFNPRTIAFTNNGGYTTSLSLFGKELYIAADYQDSIQGLARGRLAAVDTSSSNPTSFNPMPDNNAKTVNIGNNKLFAGGSWDNVGSLFTPSYFAVYTLQPQARATNLSFSSLLPQSVTATWTSGSGEKRIAVLKQAASPTAPTDGKTYTSSAVFKSGQSTGAASFAVANGTGNSVNVTNLLPNNTYTLSVYEYNGGGSATDYLQTPALTGTITTPCPTYSQGIDSSGPLTRCGGSVTLTAASGFSNYLWSTTATTRSIVASTTGTYSVSYTDSNGCSGNASVIVTIHPVPSTATISPTPSPCTNLCPGTSVNLRATLSSSYLWSTGATSRIITTSTASSYSVTVFNVQGCSKTSNAKTVSYSSCLKPIPVIADSITTNSATIRWRAVRCAVGYSVQYRRGSAAYTTVTVPPTDTSLQLTGLVANSNYNWRVATICQSSPLVMSAYCNTQIFATPTSFAKGITGNIAETSDESWVSARVFPNPADATTLVEFKSIKPGPYIIELTDAVGKVVMLKKGIAITGKNKVSLDVSRFAKGMYLVSIYNGEHNKEILKLTKD